MGTEKIELPWWPRERPPARERAPLTRAEIVDAAIRMIDRDGLEALSMRRLAEACKVSVTSLYWRVQNKEELLELVVDALAGEVNALYASSHGRSWRENAATFARAVRAVVREDHPQAAILFLPRMALGPNVLDGMDLLLAALRQAGLEGEPLYFAYWSVLTYAYGAAIREAATVTSDPGPRDTASRDLAAVLSPERFANVLAVAPVIARGDPAAQFEYGLQRLLDGIALSLGETKE